MIDYRSNIISKITKLLGKYLFDPGTGTYFQTTQKVLILKK